MDWSPVHSASYLFLILVAVTSYGGQDLSCKLSVIEKAFDYEYYQEGDVLIGGLVSAHDEVVEHKFAGGESILKSLCAFIDIEDYRAILAFIFAVDEINQDPGLLPNITLGYHIFDTCADPKTTLGFILRILSGINNMAPNYSCSTHGEVAAFVGDSGFLTSHAMAQFLNLYKYTQINYEVTDPLFNDRDLYPNFYRIVPDDRIRYAAIIQCLKYFGWNWVGILTLSDGSGEMEYRELSAMMAEHEICIEFVIKLHSERRVNVQRMAKIGEYTARVLVICAEFSARYVEFFDDSEAIRHNFTLILHESWLNVKYTDTSFFPMVNGSLIFVLPKRNVPNINAIIHEVNPSNRPGDPLLEDLWLQLFYCLSTNRRKNYIFQFIYQFSGVNCTRTYRLPSSFHGIRDTKTYYTYTVVYVLAHALHALNLKRDKAGTYKLRQKVNRYMKKVHYMDVDGEDLFFNERGGPPSTWLLANWVIYEKENNYDFIVKPLASFEESLKSNFLEMDREEIKWKNGAKPQSRCNVPCSPGYRKAPNGGYHICCYDCVPCSEGEFSNITVYNNGPTELQEAMCRERFAKLLSDSYDSEICHKCPEDEWPDEKKVKCAPKTLEFLSYEKDLLVVVLSVMSLLFSAVTLLIIGSFIYYWDTPLVKANNRTVSFILLVSIVLSFLCVFLFLGRPMDTTCLLRQTVFGIFFSITVSSVLGKTITVCIAFKATKPGSPWVKWISLKVSNYVVLICSSVQVLLCVLWLLVSPPYVEFDHKSYSGKIIVQCNEGSDIWFYSMLGYLGLLAAVSFVLAFMVRTLPDTFNEAKYITFSMLVFCTVWIAMVPAYLSTKGKSMVVLEIFAILTSSAGVLGCIFGPKLHIIILRPHLNTRKIIL